ncbi:hypothetical protein [Thiothrix eikelboomii]|uniref:hypothetical protein n=1 Tax=Thiothrix eikelboomii TaxID=92487 RepID=UPI003BB1CC0D
MKNLSIKALLAAFLMSSSLLSGGSVMASLDTLDESITAGTACKAYTSSQEAYLKPQWSTIKSLANVWVHCPGSGDGDGFDNGDDLIFNLEIPLDAAKDVYNCYLSSQAADGDSSSQHVIWEAGSDAGKTQVEIRAVNINGSFPGDYRRSITSGCYLYKGQMLHSVQVGL